VEGELPKNALFWHLGSSVYEGFGWMLQIYPQFESGCRLFVFLAYCAADMASCATALAPNAVFSACIGA